MPIRFRCVYCDKLLGIARRKAGAVVSCPHCAEKLIVPTPEPEESALGPSVDELKGADEDDGGGPRLFEHSDFDALLAGQPTFRSSDGENGRPPVKPSPGIFDMPPAPLPAPMPLPHPASRSASSAASFAHNDMHRPPGFYISPSKATWLSVAAVVLLALTFGLGLIVGRMIK